MGQQVGTLPATDVTVDCQGKVTADVIQRQIRNRGAQFATSPDADLLRTASRWVSEEHSWVLNDMQLVVYGETCSWVFYAGSRSNQVVFHASGQTNTTSSGQTNTTSSGQAASQATRKIDEPAWERKGWRTRLYYGVKMALKLIGKALAAIAPCAAVIPALGPGVGAGMAAAGGVALAISEAM